MQGRHEENPCRRLEAKTRNSVNRHVSPRSTTLFAMDLQSQALACSFKLKREHMGCICSYSLQNYMTVGSTPVSYDSEREHEHLEL